MIKYIQIFILLLSALFSSETINHTVSIQYNVTEKLKLFSLKDIITIEIAAKEIGIKPKGFGSSILDKNLEYKNQNISENNIFYTLLVEKIVPDLEDEWINSFFLLEGLAIKTRFLLSEKLDEKRVYRLDVKQLNKKDIDDRVNMVILNSDVIKIWTDEEKNITKISLMFKNISYVINIKNE